MMHIATYLSYGWTEGEMDTLLILGIYEREEEAKEVADAHHVIKDHGSPGVVTVSDLRAPGSRPTPAVATGVTYFIACPCRVEQPCVGG